MYKGIYVWGPEVHSFTPCEKNHNYWVSFDWAGFEMQEHYKSSKKEPYRPMYIEFRGQTLNEKVDGFALDYSGLIRISEVFQYTFNIPESCR